MLVMVTTFALLTVAKCAAGPYYTYESVQLDRTGVEGDASADLLATWESVYLRGGELGVRFGPINFLRTEDIPAAPETLERLERDQRRLTYRGCGRQPVHWVPIWPGRFRAEPTGDAVEFTPATLEIDEHRYSATLTLEADGGPVVMTYHVGATGKAGGCSATGDRPPAALLGLLLIVGLSPARRRTGAAGTGTG